MRYGRSLAVQPNCLKGRVVYGTVYGEMHLKDPLGSIVRVWYRIPFPDFYLVLHGLRCRKSTIMDSTSTLQTLFLLEAWDLTVDISSPKYIMENIIYIIFICRTLYNN